MSRKQRARYLSSGQKEILIEFLEDHKHLRSGKFNSNFTFRQAQMLWQQLATKLNSVPGSRKDWRQWRKTWQDIRTKTKYKQASIYKLNIESMKANIPIESLTPIEERIVTIIENDTKSAHRETKEYSTSVGTQDAPIIETKLEMIDDIDEFQQGCEGIDEFEEKYQPKELNHPEIIGIFEEQTGTQVLKANETTSFLCNNAKEEYYKKKLEILERNVEAKNRIAKALEDIAEKLNYGNSITQNNDV